MRKWQMFIIGRGMQAKVSLGDEVRQMHLMANTTYAELLEAVRAKFPSAPPFAIKYVDRCTSFS